MSAPKHPSIRRRTNDPKQGFTLLPAAGREGEIPPWPLRPNLLMSSRLEHARDAIAALQVQLAGGGDGRTMGRLRRELTKAELVAATLTIQIEQATDAETELWAGLWRTPQAVVWEESHALREVAQYVRWKIQAEQGDLKAASEARQLSDRLGLNPLALLRLRLEIEHVAEAREKADKRRDRQPQRPRDPRGHLRGL